MTGGASANGWWNAVPSVHAVDPSSGTHGRTDGRTDERRRRAATDERRWRNPTTTNRLQMKKIEQGLLIEAPTTQFDIQTVVVDIIRARCCYVPTTAPFLSSF